MMAGDRAFLHDILFAGRAREMRVMIASVVLAGYELSAAHVGMIAPRPDGMAA